MVKEKIENEHESIFYPAGHERQTILEDYSFRIENENLDRIRLKQILEFCQEQCAHFGQTLTGTNRDLALAKQANRILTFKGGKGSCYETD